MNTTNQAREVNLVGLPGPSHNFGGLAFGNLASMENRLFVSRPRDAVLQVLDMMKCLHELGVPQIVMPPHERPDLATLRCIGFQGPDVRLIEEASKSAPKLLSACYSSSAMWTANAATVCPSADASDGRVHITPANLTSQFHRSIESPFTAFLLRQLFPAPQHFVHHPPLPATPDFGDEGAANHMRLSATHGSPGIHCFVYGRVSGAPMPGATRFPARQAEEAARALARLPRLNPDAVIHAQQGGKAIDMGVFHNDVIATGNLNFLLCHEHAYRDNESVLAAIKKGYHTRCQQALTLRQVSSDELSLQEAVESYLFNSQLIELPNKAQAIVAPLECRQIPKAATLLDRLVDESNPVEAIHYVTLNQSMRNGGGPACLRLRVVLTGQEQRSVPQNAFFSEALYDKLRQWAQSYYRERLHIDDLRDPQLINETRAALAELSRILDLGHLYPFRS